MIKLRVMVPLALGAVGLIASQSSGREGYVCPSGTHWIYSGGINGQNGHGTVLPGGDHGWRGVHVDCSGSGTCVEVSGDTLWINGAGGAINGYDQNDPMQAIGDVLFSS